jgi:hypothetical protein
VPLREAPLKREASDHRSQCHSRHPSSRLLPPQEAAAPLGLHRHTLAAIEASGTPSLILYLNTPTNSLMTRSYTHVHSSFDRGHALHLCMLKLSRSKLKVMMVSLSAEVRQGGGGVAIHDVELPQGKFGVVVQL